MIARTSPATNFHDEKVFSVQFSVNAMASEELALVGNQAAKPAAVRFALLAMLPGKVD